MQTTEKNAARLTPEQLYAANCLLVSSKWRDDEFLFSSPAYLQQPQHNYEEVERSGGRCDHLRAFDTKWPETYEEGLLVGAREEEGNKRRSRRRKPSSSLYHGKPGKLLCGGAFQLSHKYSMVISTSSSSLYRESYTLVNPKVGSWKRVVVDNLDSIYVRKWSQESINPPILSSSEPFLPGPLPPIIVTYYNVLDEWFDEKWAAALGLRHSSLPLPPDYFSDPLDGDVGSSGGGRASFSHRLPLGLDPIMVHCPIQAGLQLPLPTLKGGACCLPHPSSSSSPAAVSTGVAVPVTPSRPIFQRHTAALYDRSAARLRSRGGKEEQENEEKTMQTALPPPAALAPPAGGGGGRFMGRGGLVLNYSGTVKAAIEAIEEKNRLKEASGRRIGVGCGRSDDLLDGVISDEEEEDEDEGKEETPALGASLSKPLPSSSSSFPPPRPQDEKRAGEGLTSTMPDNWMEPVEEAI